VAIPIKRLSRLYDYRCAHCNKKTEFLTADHIVPRYFGGGNNSMNIQPLCRECNDLKGADLTRVKADQEKRKKLEFRELERVRNMKMTEMIEKLNSGMTVKKLEAIIKANELKKAKEPGKRYGKCESCEAKTVLEAKTGLCGPCCFGEADTANGNW
jgi:hypothetical protein